MKVVVVDERDTTAKGRVQGAPINMLEMALPGSSAGCDFPAKTICTGRRGEVRMRDRGAPDRGR